MQNVPESLRGELTRYMLELKAGVFIGELNSRVTELLWEKVTNSVQDGGAILAKNDINEQGYSLKITGNTNYVLEELDGITMIKKIREN